MRRLVALAITAALLSSSCAVFGGGGPRTYKAVFSRAIQLFPGGSVRILGVDVGHVQDVRNISGGVEVTLAIDDPNVQLPADVEAVIVPVSLLGERYVQLLPAYTGGPTLEEGAVIPQERTAVPAEPDELLRSLQDYLGAIDPEAVTVFVENASAVLEGTGERLNNLIRHGTRVVSTLAERRHDLAAIVVEFERLTSTLATRQDAIGRVIRSYNEVVGTLAANRSALEGTIIGLNEAATELASLLGAHRDPLGEDIRSLTRTGRTLSRNIETLAQTGHWAKRLFRAARRAVDFDHDWLRLQNQGQHLAAMILMRLRQRLVELCDDLGLPTCATPMYWSREAPSLFCFARRCPTEEEKSDAPAQEQLADAIEAAPPLVDRLLRDFRRMSCKGADDWRDCIERKRILIECAKSDRPNRCIRERAEELDCPDLGDLQACVRRERRAGLEDLVEGVLDRTLRPQNVLGGSG